MKDPRRWLLLLSGASLMALGLYSAVQPKAAKPRHGLCLAHRDCLSDERCFVVPAADGFAAGGQCATPCTDGLECDRGLSCLEVAVAPENMTPTDALHAGPERSHLCLPPSDSPH